MTSFCGYFYRRHAPGCNNNSVSLDVTKQKARSCLSRNLDHRIQEYSDPHLFIVAFDNGAWSDGFIHKSDKGNVGWVSGNPLLTDEYGEALSVSDSRSKVLEALEASNNSALSATFGSFSAVVWNPQQQRLRLCADKLGLRPVYLYLFEELCYFSTSLRVLRSILPVDLELDDEGVGQFLYLGQCIADKTCYKNVQVITPGGFVDVASHTTTKSQYYSWNNIPPATDQEFDGISAKAHSIFMDATKRRCSYLSEADAFLTGGMDSRSVVAALMDCGLAVRGFNYSYKNSADDILARMLAEKLGVECVFYESDPRERLKVNVDYFALKAKLHFPLKKPQTTARLIWSGDGGSVGLGHVYMTERNVALAEKQLDEAIAKELFVSFNKPASRLLHRSVDKQLRNMAMDSLIRYWGQLSPRQPCRRIFLYYLLNDQMRHLHHHYEEIDISNIEFEMPFFDMGFLEFVVSLPVKPFLNHKLYNNWIKRFVVPVSNVPWQSYPGHEPCPLTLPNNILSQWGTDWYGGRTGRDVSKIVINSILSDKRNGGLYKYLNSYPLYALKMLMSFGIDRYNYEASFARRIYEEIAGKFIFDIYK